MKSSDVIDLETVVEQNKELFSDDLDGDTILLSVTRAAYYGLDSTAQSIWNMIAQPSRVADLCEQLVAEYDIDRTTCEQKVCDFLNQLNKEGLIHVVAENGG